MPQADYPLHAELISVIRARCKTEILDRFHADMGLGSVFFIANNTPYELRFDLDEAPDEFVLKAGADNPFMEADRRTMQAFMAAMQKAYPEVSYGFGNVCNLGMLVSVRGRVPASPDRALAVTAEFLRCKQLLDECIGGQDKVAADI